MTCKGYDPKAVKIGKPIKRMAAKIVDSQQRRAFIRDYVRLLENQTRGSKKGD